METSFSPSRLYRVQVCPKLDSRGLPFDEFFDERNPFPFDSNGNYFTVVSKLDEFKKMIDSDFSDFLFIKSIAHYEFFTNEFFFE